MASLFLTGGTVAEVREADGTTERVAVTPGACVTSAPLVVLVDEGTGSAAEVVAAALHDHGRAELVGAVTAGNGTVRSVKTLSFGGAVAYATAEFLTPDGNKVDGVGIIPDVVVAAADPLPAAYVKVLAGLTALESAASAAAAQSTEAIDPIESAHEEQDHERAEEEIQPIGEGTPEDGQPLDEGI